MPSQRHHEPGDMFVKLNVTFPESIEARAIPLLEQALPPRKPMDTFEKNIILDEVHMDDVDMRSRNAMRDEPMDEDADGEPRVQCANQ
jgi:DnaJ homolog subfamily A member 2